MSTSVPNPEDIHYDDSEFEGDEEGGPEEEINNAFHWNIQLTIIIVVIVGLVALGTFPLCFWLSRRKSGRKMLHPPSRMSAIWTNIQILPLKTSQLFERRPSAIPPRISSQARNMDAFQVEEDTTDDSSPICTDQATSSRHTEPWSNTTTIVYPDQESSDLNYEDAKAELTASMYDLSHTPGKDNNAAHPYSSIGHTSGVDTLTNSHFITV